MMTAAERVLMESTELQQLRDCLIKFSPGNISDTKPIEEVLAAAWEHLQGSDGGMAGYKLHERMESVQWAPPLLTFVIERHGGTVMGSGYAELQRWSVNVEAGSAKLIDQYKKRWLGGPRNTPLNVEPIAAQVVQLIVSGKEDPMLKWKSAAEVQIVIGKVVPDNCPQQTLVGRRARFKKAITEALREHGWEYETGRNVARKSA